MYILETTHFYEMYHRLWRSLSFYVLQFALTGGYDREVSICFPLVFLRKRPMSCGCDEMKQERESSLSLSAKTAKWAQCPGLLRRGCSEQERDGRRGEGPPQLDCFVGHPSLADEPAAAATSHCSSLGGAVTRVLRAMSGVRAKTSCVRTIGDTELPVFPVP